MTPARPARLVSLVCFTILAACTSTRRIDGSSADAFERSVASLRNELTPGRRADLDASLAAIWMRVAAANGGDVDGDGNTESFDARALLDATNVLLAKIRRGELVAAIEERDDSVAADYFEQLHGLGLDEVVALAELDSADPYLAELHRRVTCSRPLGSATLPPPSTPLTRRCSRARP